MALVKSPPVRKPRRIPVPAALDLDSLSELEGPRAIVAVQLGLDAKLVRQLAEKLGLPLETIAVPLHLTGRTLHRRLEAGRLSLDESERLLALAKILKLATTTLGSLPKAVRWMKSGVPALGGKTPLECAETQIGLREIEDVLVRIEDVVYS
jgi:putative toxin-antitoxin system antitoxin component (TIGR02293 family)